MNSLNSISRHQIHTIKVTSLDTYSVSQEQINKLRIILIEKGNCIAEVNGKSLSLFAPLILCLDEKDIFIIKQANGLLGKVLSFHPSSLSETFNYDNVRHFDHDFSFDDIKLVTDLSIFFNRHNNYNGQITTSEPVLKQLSKMIDMLTQTNDPLHSISDKLSQIIAFTSQLVKTTSLLSSVVITETNFEVKDVLLYLHTYYKQKITIPELSKHFHVNRTTLSDRFYEATGETIITYLNKYRINLSALLLRESTLTISDIADEVGFNDTAYFAKLFRKYMHHSPSGYRERYYALTKLHSVHTKNESK